MKKLRKQNALEVDNSPTPRSNAKSGILRKSLKNSSLESKNNETINNNHQTSIIDHHNHLQLHSINYEASHTNLKNSSPDIKNHEDIELYTENNIITDNNIQNQTDNNLLNDQKINNQINLISDKYSTISPDFNRTPMNNMTTNENYQNNFANQSQSLFTITDQNASPIKKNDDVKNIMDGYSKLKTLDLSPIKINQRCKKRQNVAFMHSNEFLTTNQLQVPSDQNLNSNKSPLIFQQMNNITSRRSTYVQPLIKQKTLSQIKEVEQVETSVRNLNNIWDQSGIKILVLVSIFYHNMLRQIQSKKFQTLTSNHFRILGDNTAYYQYFVYNDILVGKKKGYGFLGKCFFQFSGSLGKHSCLSSKKVQRFLEFCASQIIIPDSFLKIVWDTFILLLLIINIFYIPVKIAFENSPSFYVTPLILFIIDSVPQLAFLFDIFMNFNTAFYDKGKLVTNRKIIAINYVRGKFIWDFIIITPYLISQYYNVPYIDMILLLRQKKIRLIIKSYEELINLRNKNKAIYDLGKLILMILFVAHFTGCWFYYVAALQTIADDNTITWLKHYEIDQSHWLDQYFVSLYWATITMITVGYGDITPKTTVERQVMVMITLVSCGVFAYSVNQVGTIVINITKRDSEFQDKMSLLTTYMRKRGLDKDLQMRVKNYFEYLHEENMKENEDAESILQTLCDSIKQNVYHDIYYKELASKKLFSLNFSKQFLKMLSTKIQEVWIGPEEQIFTKDAYLDHIFILIKGEIEFYIKSSKPHKSDQQTIKIVGPGEVFGIEQFFLENKTVSDAKTNNVVLLMKINRLEFQQLLKQFPQDDEMFNMIKEHLIYQNDRKKVLNNYCYVCNQKSHTFDMCPTLKYKVNIQKQISSFQKQDQKMQRYTTSSREKDKYHVFENLSYIKHQALLIMINIYHPTEFTEVVQNLMEDSHLILNSDSSSSFDDLEQQESAGYRFPQIQTDNNLENINSVLKKSKFSPKSNKKQITFFEDSDLKTDQSIELQKKTKKSKFSTNLIVNNIATSQSEDANPDMLISLNSDLSSSKSKNEIKDYLSKQITELQQFTDPSLDNSENSRQNGNKISITDKKLKYSKSQSDQSKKIVKFSDSKSSSDSNSQSDSNSDSISQSQSHSQSSKSISSIKKSQLSNQSISKEEEKLPQFRNNSKTQCSTKPGYKPYPKSNMQYKTRLKSESISVASQPQANSSNDSDDQQEQQQRDFKFQRSAIKKLSQKIVESSKPKKSGQSIQNSESISHQESVLNKKLGSGLNNSDNDFNQQKVEYRRKFTLQTKKVKQKNEDNESQSSQKIQNPVRRLTTKSKRQSSIFMNPQHQNMLSILQNQIKQFQKPKSSNVQVGQYMENVEKTMKDSLQVTPRYHTNTQITNTTTATNKAQNLLQPQGSYQEMHVSKQMQLNNQLNNQLLNGQHKDTNQTQIIDINEMNDVDRMNHQAINNNFFFYFKHKIKTDHQLAKYFHQKEIQNDVYIQIFMNQNIQYKEWSLLPDFDKQKDYQYYYHKHNYSQIIQNYEKSISYLQKNQLLIESKSPTKIRQEQKYTTLIQQIQSKNANSLGQSKHITKKHK